jgi:general stress protein YciG
MPKRLKKAAITVAPDPLDFGSQLSAYMSKLGSKGGKVSGAKRMEMPEKLRKAIARKGGLARAANRRPKAKG